jgi:hypothetical protein
VKKEESFIVRYRIVVHAMLLRRKLLYFGLVWFLYVIVWLQIKLESIESSHSLDQLEDAIYQLDQLYQQSNSSSSIRKQMSPVRTTTTKRPSRSWRSHETLQVIIMPHSHCDPGSCQLDRCVFVDAHLSQVGYRHSSNITSSRRDIFSIISSKH